MSAGLETDVLKGVSRSFYLSLRLLPTPMRRAASIAYLLARASDTIADSAEVPAGKRLDFLRKFSKQIRGEERPESWPLTLLSKVPDGKERLLLEWNVGVIWAMESLPPAEITLVREVLDIIVSGQVLDLERFDEAGLSNVISLSSDAELIDYAWRVAGCVGVFWTKLGYETLGGKFSEYPEEELLNYAEDYGKGLQLVNILRDLPSDLESGRCYLPGCVPADREDLMRTFYKWHAMAVEKVACSEKYSALLASRRLRLASGLPGAIASETLAMMEGTSWNNLQERIKVPRRRVYRLALDTWLRMPST